MWVRPKYQFLFYFAESMKSKLQKCNVSCFIFSFELSVPFLSVHLNWLHALSQISRQWEGINMCISKKAKFGNLWQPTWRIQSILTRSKFLTFLYWSEMFTARFRILEDCSALWQISERLFIFLTHALLGVFLSAYFKPPGSLFVSFSYRFLEKSLLWLVRWTGSVFWLVSVAGCAQNVRAVQVSSCFFARFLRCSFVLRSL